MSDVATLLRESVERYASQPRGGGDRWRDYADQGWLALRLPETHGGVDADAATIGALMEAVGYSLLQEPLLGTAVLGAGVLLRSGSKALQAYWLPRIADGSGKLAVAEMDGSTDCVLHADVADAVIVVTKGSLSLVKGAALRRRPLRLVDGRGAAEVRFDHGDAEPVGGSAADLLDELRVATCAEALGVIRALVAATRDYLVARTQFGKPLAANQALVHRLVELHLLLEESRALVTDAQHALSQPAPARDRVIAGARAYILAALKRTANEAVQMHGGIGITEELAVSHYYRRAMVLQGFLGGRDTEFARFAEACA